MRFWKIVAAYLTGWVIAQAFYNRVIHPHLPPPPGWDEQKDDIARRVIEQLFARGIEVE